MDYRIIPVTAFAQNATLLWCEETREAAVVDPGGDLDEILAVSARTGVSIEKILLTHGHIDHAGGTAALARRLGVPIEGPQREEEFWITQLPQQSRMFGFAHSDAFTPDRWLEDGDTVTVGLLVLDVLHTPGHVVLFHAPSRLAIVGEERRSNPFVADGA